MNKDLEKKEESAEIGLLKNIISTMSAYSSPTMLKNIATATFVVSIFCLLGALLMWRLRIIGFYLYTAGTIISIALPIYMFGSNFMSNMSSGVQAFIGVLFVIFYAMNLKSMK